MRLLRHLPRFRQAYRALGELEARERWSRPQVEAWQLERLNAVWAHARAHVPYYRRLAAELPPRFASLDEFRAGLAASAPPGSRPRRRATSGNRRG